MTTKMTYRLGVSEDCTDATLGDYTEIRQNMLDADATLTVQNDDVFRIDAKPDSATLDEWCYYKKTVDTTTTFCPSYALRYRTDDATTGMGAAVSCVVDGVEEFILGSLTVPVFNYSWTSKTGNFTGSGAITEIRFYANDYPDSITGGASAYVYYDFLLLGNLFTFPYISKGGKGGGLTLHMHKDYGKVKGLRRFGDYHQGGGLASPQIILEGDMDTRTTWLTSPTGKALYWLFAKNDAFQWFESDAINCKVVPVDLDIVLLSGSGKQRIWSLILEEYSRSSGISSSWSNLEWLGW